MANISSGNKKDIFTLEKFLGLNLSNTGDTQIKEGESGNMTNWYITSDYKLKKFYGYKQIYKFDSKPQGMYSTTINNVKYLLIAIGGHLYSILEESLVDESTWETLVPVDLGELEDSPTTFFSFDKKVYILNGNKYRCWDGVTLREVEGYIPLVFISTPPAGGGTAFESINLLTGKKHQTFNGNGTDKIFQLAENNILSIEKVIVNAIEITNYTVDLNTGKVTLKTAPTEAMDNVDIYWTGINNDRDFIDKMRAAIIFGGGVDTRVFLYGNEDEQNRIRYSSIANKVPSVEYFPAVNQIDIGANNFAVTDLRRHYDRLLVTTNKPDAYYISLDSLDIEGYTTLSPITYPLNEVHGNIAFAQGQVINNDPVTIEENSIIRWKSTSVRDERNANDISERIKKDIVDISLKNAITLDYQKESQLWICCNDDLYIYNYYNDTFSRIKLAHSFDKLVLFNNEIYGLTEDGIMVKFSENYQTFNGEIIKAHWEMNFSDFKAEYLRKNMNRVWILMQPQGHCSADIGYITNRNELAVKKHIEYSVAVLDDVDFANFSFAVSSNPQPFRLKLKAKKFTNLKMIIDNEEETDATILALTLRYEYGGESK